MIFEVFSNLNDSMKEAEHVGEQQRVDLAHKQTYPFSSRSHMISQAVRTSLPFPCLLPSSSIPRSQRYTEMIHTTDPAGLPRSQAGARNRGR